MKLDENSLPKPQEGQEADYIDRLRALEQDAWKSSKSLREWADNYCAASRSVKEFTFQQEMYGWNIEKFKSLIRATLEKLEYSGDVAVDFWNLRGRIHVRPDSTISKLVLKLRHGGGIWKTTGVAYPLIGWVDAYGGDESAIKTSSGFKRRVGTTEEEWYNKWEKSIVKAVNDNLESDKPLVLLADV